MRAFLALLLVLAGSPTSAQEFVPASPAEEAAVAAAVVEGMVALADFDSNAVAATADPALLDEMAQVRDLALTLPPERFLPPFDGEACAPLWASLRILELRRDYGTVVLEAMTGEDLLHLAIVDSRGPSAYTWQRVLNKGDAEGARAQLRADPVAVLRALGAQNLYIAGDRAYAAIAGYEPAEVSLALRQPDGSWRPDYRYHLQFWREAEIATIFAYASRTPVEPAMLTAQQFLAGLAVLLSHEPMPPADLERLAQPLAAGGSFTCLPPINSAPLVRCLDGSASCG